MDIFCELESNIRSYCRAFPAIFHRASGHYVYDEQGRRYLDFLCGAGAVNYGHNPPNIVAAVAAYLNDGGITTSLDLHTVAKRKFLETFRDVILRPRGLDYVVQFTGPTGTNAVEAALKLARMVTNRSNVVAFTNGYHGASLGALATTGNRAMRVAAGMALGPVTRIPYEGYCDLDGVGLLDALLSDPSSGVDAPAAIIVEVIQGEGGLHMASEPWLRALETVARRHGALLIVDDIQAGCGRSGRFFSFEGMGIGPDIVCLSKSIGGMGLPMAITLFRRELDKWQVGQHTGTFRGNNLAFVAAKTALDDYWADPSFAISLRARASYFNDLLKAIERCHGHSGCKLRGRGFMRGLAFNSNKEASAISRICFENGLIVETCGPNDEVVKLLPPITIDEASLAVATSILDSAISRVFETSLAEAR